MIIFDDRITFSRLVLQRRIYTNYKNACVPSIYMGTIVLILMYQIDVSLCLLRESKKYFFSFVL